MNAIYGPGRDKLKGVLEQRDGAVLLPLTGVVLLMLPIASWVVFGPLPTDEGVMLAFSGAFALGVVVGGLLIYRSTDRVLSDGIHRIFGWIFGGVGLFSGLTLTLTLVGDPDPLYTVVNVVSLGASVGGAVGMLSGSLEARAIEHARAKERHRTTSDRIEAERARLDYLNAMLRHEVLNGVTIIKGHTNLAIEQCECNPEVTDHLETVVSHTEDLAGTTKEVRKLLNAKTDDLELRPTDAADVLAQEVDTLRDRYPNAHVEVSGPDTAIVRADEMLSTLFSNLLSNAVEHNDSEVPRVTVTIDRTTDAVRIRVEDNGPGLPPDRLEVPFERGRGDHGLGLYLIRALVDRYDGSITFVDTGPTGTTFAIELPSGSAGSESEHSRRTLA